LGGDKRVVSVIAAPFIDKVDFPSPSPRIWGGRRGPGGATPSLPAAARAL